MDHQFWRDKWHKNEIGFHKSEAHPMLVAHLDDVSLTKGARIFLPLCGKTLDIAWLHERGYHVLGAELSEIAVEALFQSMGISPEKTQIGQLTRYSAERLDIYAGDVFELSQEMLGAVDAIYDRAALVALPEDMRTRYAAHLPELTKTAPQLLITFDYIQTEMQGPPFSVPLREVRRLYDAKYDIAPLTSGSVEGGLKGLCPAMEEVWLLREL